MLVGLANALNLVYLKELRFTFEVFQRLFLHPDSFKMSRKVKSHKIKQLALVPLGEFFCSLSEVSRGYLGQLSSVGRVVRPVIILGVVEIKKKKKIRQQSDNRPTIVLIHSFRF